MPTPTPTPDARRRRILDAARTVFQREGGLDAGLRPIAAQAGCTTGAIYRIFSGKEDIYAALLEDSLIELGRDVAAAAGREAKAESALRAAAHAFLDYYLAHPFEYKLGLYLFERDGKKGLGPARDAQLNALLDQALTAFQACFQRLGAPDARAAAHALFAVLIGALSMAVAGRDRSLKTQAQQVLDSALDLMLLPWR